MYSVGTRREYETHYHELEGLTRENGVETRLLAEMDAAWARWNDQYLVPLTALCDMQPADAKRPTQAELDRIAERGNALRQAVLERVSQMVQKENGLAEKRQTSGTVQERQTANWFIGIGIVSLILTGLSCTSLLRWASMQDQSQRSLEEEVEQRALVQLRLKDSEGRVRTVLDNVPDGIITIDQAGIIESFNPAAEMIFGYLAEHVIGRSVNVLMPDPFRSQHSGFMERYARTGETQILGRRRELLGQRADGSRFELDLAVTEMTIDGERIFTGIVRDISETKRQVTEIQRFKATLDNTLDIIFMCDPVSLKFVYVNRGAQQALGYSRKELLQLRASDLTPSMPEHVFRSHVAQLLSGARPWLSYETLHRRKDGSELPTEVFLQLVRDHPDDPGLFIGIARDLTERRKVDQLKSEFISIVSHELRTPLTSIRGSLGLLIGGAAGELGPRVRRMVEIAHHNSERLVRLINDMLDMEKIESGKMRFDMRPLATTPLVQNALEMNRGYGEQYEIEFVADPDAVDAHVFGDFDRLIQVLTNLLSNAAKFSPAGGQVRVAVTQTEKLVRIAVIDRGPGIPKDFEKRLFERFSQADTSDARQKGGTGLGLSICKAIVERHDGSLGFESELGSGSTFWIELPRWESPAPARPDTRVGSRILVCDEDRDLAEVLTAMLREDGFAVDVAYSAREAKRLLAERVYALMAVDSRVHEDGNLLLQNFGSGDPAWPRMPIIVVSGGGDEAQTDLASGHVVLDWIAKPIDSERLITAVRRAMQRSKERINILHVEDDADVRRVLTTLLGSEVDVTGAQSVAQATALLEGTTYDLVVLDVGLPDASGLALLAHMRGRNAHTPVLVFSAHDPSPELAERVAAALVKSKTSNSELLAMVRRLVA